MAENLTVFQHPALCRHVPTPSDLRRQRLRFDRAAEKRRFSGHAGVHPANAGQFPRFPRQSSIRQRIGVMSLGREKLHFCEGGVPK